MTKNAENEKDLWVLSPNLQINTRHLNHYTEELTMSETQKIFQ